MLETLDFTINIGSTPIYPPPPLNIAYTAHYTSVSLSFIQKYNLQNTVFNMAAAGFSIR